MFKNLKNWFIRELAEEVEKLKQKVDKMATQLEDTIQALKDARVQLAAVRKEQTDLRTTLTERIKALEDIIAAGGTTPEILAALKVEVDGLKEDLGTFDADIPNATA